MTSRGGSDTKGCGCGRGCKGKCKGSRNASVSVPSSTGSSAFSRSSTPSYSHIRYHSNKKLRVYYLKAQLLPQNCICLGNTAQCPFFATPSFATVPNPNLPSGYGKAKFTIIYDPITKLGQTSWKISYAKLYSLGNQVFNPIRGIEVRVSSRCSVPGPIILNPLAIALLATGGESPDCYVTGSYVFEKDRVQQFLHNLCYVVIRTLQFLTLAQGELNGRIRFQRKQKISRK